LLCGCADIEVDPGSFEVVHEASGARTPPFDVPFGGPTIVTFIHWVTEAPERAVVVINALECPIDAVDSIDEGDVIDLCDGESLPGIDFTVAGQTRTTNQDGIVIFVTPAGDVTIVEDPASVAGYAGISVGCFSSLDGEIPIPGEGGGTLFSGRADDGEVTIEVEAFSETFCSWVHLTDESGPAKTPTPTSGSARDVTTLPNTGAANGSSGGLPFVFWAVILALPAAAFGIRRVRRSPSTHRRR
jgi:hypothetical protein